MAEQETRLTMKGLKLLHKASCRVTREETVTVAGHMGQPMQITVKRRTLKKSLKVWARTANVDDRPRSPKVRDLLK